jgi:hypothetical protein
MWMAYFRFDTDKGTRNAFVLTANNAENQEVIGIAKRLFGKALTEYATFYSGRNIYPREEPNFPERLIFDYRSFLEACGVPFYWPGQQPENAGTSPPSSGPLAFLLGSIRSNHYLPG